MVEECETRLHEHWAYAGLLNPIEDIDRSSDPHSSVEAVSLIFSWGRIALHMAIDGIVDDWPRDAPACRRLERLSESIVGNIGG